MKHLDEANGPLWVVFSLGLHASAAILGVRNRATGVWANILRESADLCGDLWLHFHALFAIVPLGEIGQAWPSGTHPFPVHWLLV